MSFDRVVTLLRTVSFVILAVAALVFSLRSVPPSHAESPASPGVVCATPLEANDGKVPAFNATKYKDAYERWMNARLGEGRDQFFGVANESLWMVCAW